MSRTILEDRPALTGFSKNVAGSANISLYGDEAAHGTLTFTGALTGNISVTLPVTAGNVGQEWRIFNSTTGAFTLTVKGPTGSGVAVLQGSSSDLRWNGSDMEDASASALLSPVVLTASLASEIPLTLAGHASQSEPVLIVTGAPPAATTKSLVRIGDALVGGSADGAYVGINAPVGYVGDHVTFQLDGSTRFRIISNGSVRIGVTTGMTLSGLSGGLYIRGSANDSTTCALTVENLLEDTLATADLHIRSASAAGGLIAYPATYATAALQDRVGLFTQSSATGMIFFLAADTQSWRFNAGGGNIITLTGASPAVMTLQDAFNIVAGSTTGLKMGTATTQKIGVWNNTPVVRPAAYTQTYATATRTHSNPTATALTDNTAGTANTTLEALADGMVYANDVAAIRNNFADLAASVNAAIVDIANVKQVLNQSIDDDQLIGWKG